MRLPRRLLLLAALGGAAAWYLQNVLRFRDPVRVPLSQAGAVLSPADGLVTFVRRIQDGRVEVESSAAVDIPNLTGMEVGEGWLLGLLVGPLDVRYVYAPVGGVARTVHLGGSQGSAPLAQALTTARLLTGRPADALGRPGLTGKERHTTILSGKYGDAGVTLVGGRSGLSAVTYARPGAEVRAGHKLAFLEGSGLVLLTLPLAAVPLVSVGDRVTGAETVAALFG